MCCDMNVVKLQCGQTCIALFDFFTCSDVRGIWTC